MKIHQTLGENQKSAQSVPLQFIIAGKGHLEDPYVHECQKLLDTIKQQFPTNVWWDFDLFFTEGALLNVGSDFGLVPSQFEPGGLVQSEFLVMDTPVICSSTGGLKDTVVDIRERSQAGRQQGAKANGLLVTPGSVEGLTSTILDAYDIFCDHTASLDRRKSFPNEKQNQTAY